MPVPVTNKRIDRFTVRDKVYDTLLGWILEGVMAPGEQLFDKELAESLGVSRTPVREALRRLEDKDLVETSANRWTRVAKVSIAEASRIYPIIIALEKLAISQAIGRLTPGDFKKMEQANADLRAALLSSSTMQASIADVNFHNVFIERSANPHLLKILQDLKTKHRLMELIFFKGSVCVEESVKGHEEMIAAFKAQDLECAKAMIEKNWQRTEEYLLERSSNEIS